MPTATTGAASDLAARRRRNVLRAEQRIQQGRAYSSRTVATLRRNGVNPNTVMQGASAAAQQRSEVADSQLSKQRQLQSQQAQQRMALLAAQRRANAGRITKRTVAVGRAAPKPATGIKRRAGFGRIVES